MTEDINKGLTDVVVDCTGISKVNPETDSLLYRGYPVRELAEQKRFEEVALLLWHGELPSAAECTEFEAMERASRALDPRTKGAIDLLPVTCHPMDVCRTATSVIGANHALTQDASPEAQLRKAQELFAAMPAVVAYDQRRRQGLEPVPPPPART